VIFPTEARIDRLFDAYYPGGEIVTDSYRYEMELPEG